MTKIEQLNQRKLSLIAQMRTMLDKESLTAEENETYARFETECAEVEVSLKREIALADVETEMRKIDVAPTVSVTKTEDKQEDKQARYSEAFSTMLRSHPTALTAETRAVLNTGTGSEGGFVVPEVFLTNVIDKLLDLSVIRQNSTVIRTISTTNIPLGVGRPTFSIISENGAYPSTDVAFDQVVLGAHKLGGIIKASDELIQDAFINISNYVADKSVEGIADQEEQFFTDGTGSGQAQGIITGSDLGKTTAAIAAVTADEVLEFIASVKAIYRKNGKLMMNSQTELAIRKLKDSQGQYLWQPSLQANVPNIFDGKPIIINEKMPDMATGVKFMGFGDMSYYNIADRGGMNIKVLPELFSVNGQVGYRVDKRFDAKLLLAETYKHMINA